MRFAEHRRSPSLSIRRTAESAQSTRPQNAVSAAELRHAQARRRKCRGSRKTRESRRAGTQLFTCRLFPSIWPKKAQFPGTYNLDSETAKRKLRSCAKPGRNFASSPTRNLAKSLSPYFVIFCVQVIANPYLAVATPSLCGVTLTESIVLCESIQKICDRSWPKGLSVSPRCRRRSRRRDERLEAFEDKDHE